jgi:ferredoxin
MAYIITETCVDLKDKSCVDVCPVDCIIDGGAEDRLLVINPDECIDCGACVDPCPVAAIFPEDEVPPEQKKFIPWNFDYFKSDADKARVRAEINAAYPEKRKTEGAP